MVLSIDAHTAIKAPLDTVYLFKSASRPTDLLPIDLWLRQLTHNPFFICLITYDLSSRGENFHRIQPKFYNSNTIRCRSRCWLHQGFDEHHHMTASYSRVLQKLLMTFGQYKHDGIYEVPRIIGYMPEGEILNNQQLNPGTSSFLQNQVLTPVMVSLSKLTK